MTREEASKVIKDGLEDMSLDYIDIEQYEALNMAIKALEQDSIAQERYEDLCEYFGEVKDILKNRDDFKAWLGRVKWHIRKAEELYEKYEQEPKTGHWITVEMTQDDGCRYTVTYCSECDEDVDYRTDYCPNCGARMVEPQESEVKE